MSCPTEVIAERMRQLMDRKGWTAQQLVDELAKVGIKWTRLIAANVLVKRRRYITVDEWLGLAYVLDVAPVHLLIPINDDQQPYHVTPGEVVRVERARAWMRGEDPLPGTDPRTYFSEVPRAEWVASVSATSTGATNPLGEVTAS